MTSTDVRPDDGPAASRDDASPWRRRGRLAAAAGVGVLSGVLTLAVADLVAGFLQPDASPVLAVGAAFIDRTPGPPKDFAVATFGSYDKLVLLAGMALALAGLSAVAGVLARRRMVAGLGLVCLLGAVAAAAALSRPGAGPEWAAPTAVGVLAGMVVLRALTSMLTARQRAEASTGPDGPAGTSRRSLLAASGGVFGLAAVSAAGGRWLATRARGTTPADVVLPAPRQAAGPVPAGAQVDVRGMPAFVTDNAGFYRVDTNLVVPRVDAEGWSLRLRGMVDTEVELGYRDLLALPLVERWVTLTCVSNEVGGKLAGNARWLGYPLAELLRRAGVKDGADMLLSTSTDGYTCSTPLAALTDGRDALLAVGMNGKPLPAEHGFPARLVVPGLYGYVSATKWVTELEVTRFDQVQAYWTRRGWAAQAPIKTFSRIDVPASFAKVPAGTVAVAGTAWAQHRGIDVVDVRVDGGPWQRAELGTELRAPGGAADTWRQWRWAWQAGPGNHTLQVRAGDATGEVQPDTRRPPKPDGATGWHAVTVQVG